MHIIEQDIKSATIVKIQVASLRFATQNAECLVLRKVPQTKKLNKKTKTREEELTETVFEY